jgi:hypothetical protein
MRPRAALYENGPVDVMISSLKLVPVGDQFDPATEHEVSAAEGALGMAFPRTFRKLQLTYGRCMFNGDATIRPPSGAPLDIFTLFGCKGEGGNCVNDFLAHPDYIARAMLPIADDIFNNRYVWSAVTGQVSFFDYTHGLGELTVADSLEQFFANIEVVPDE